MNGKQLVTWILLALVAVSVGALVWQKGQAGREAPAAATENVAVADGGPMPGGPSPAGEDVPDPVSPTAKAAPVLPAGEPSSPIPAAPTAPAAQRTNGTKAAAPPATPTAKPVQALYLHGTFRCETCNSIEDQAKRTITEDFATQIQAGQLQFASLNMDKEPHTHYGEDFQLTSASLVLTDGRGPKGRWKVLERTWDLVKDPVAFREYVGTETRAFLAAAGGN